MKLPKSGADFAGSAAAAIADGIPPSKADVTRTQSCLEEAVSLYQRVQGAEEGRLQEAANEVLAAGRPFTLKNLFAAYQEAASEKEGRSTYSAADEGSFSDSHTLLRARRQLEEVRLSMTVTANLKLLRSGYRIETAPMEKLIAALKKAEGDSARTLSAIFYYMRFFCKK